MADCYVQARGEGTKDKAVGTGARRWSKTICSTCGAEGHGAAQCRKEPDERVQWSKDGDLRCYNCNRRGYLARHYPDNAMFVSGSRSAHDGGNSRATLGVLRNGVVEGQYVRGIMPDTGCSMTMV